MALRRKRGRRPWQIDGRGGGGSIEKEEDSKERQGNDEQRRQPSVHNNQTEYGGGRMETETVAVTLVATVTTPKSTRPQRRTENG